MMSVDKGISVVKSELSYCTIPREPGLPVKLGSIQSFTDGAPRYISGMWLYYLSCLSVLEQCGAL